MQISDFDSTFFSKEGYVYDRRNNFPENVPLFTVEYYFLKDLIGTVTNADRSHLRSLIIRRWDETHKKFKDRPDGNPEARYSHDNLTADMSASFKYDFALEHLGNNWLDEHAHPRDIIFYALLQKKWWARVLSPLLILIQIWAILDPLRYIIKPRNAQDTDGDLLTWVRCQATKDDFIAMRLSWIFCTSLVRWRYGGWHKVFAIYFKEDDHPINILARLVYDSTM